MKIYKKHKHPENKVSLPYWLYPDVPNHNGLISDITGIMINSGILSLIKSKISQRYRKTGIIDENRKSYQYNKLNSV